ncbi:MAG: nitroreductase family protein [Candidatus Methanomethylophilaceae archaeon]|nr:nitroreductase family protein [Candidatus Methanomethylophilaceae archaeon]
MEFEDVIRQRYSVRKYSDRPVENWKIQKMLEAARLAPTGKNKQGQRIYVLRSPEAVKKINELCMMIFGAPVVMLVFAKKGESWISRFTGRDIAETDTSIVTDHMMLQATDLGLGTCWVGYFDPKPICEAFGIPDDLVLMHILPVGYAAEDCEPGPLHFQSKEISDFTTFL